MTMQMFKRRTVAGALSMALAMASLGMPGYAVAGEHSDNRHGDFRFASLGGAWRVEVTQYNCQTGVENPAISSFLTFGADGSLVETTSNPAFQPGQRSPGHGFWERSGPNAYRAVFEAFILFSSTLPPPAPQFQKGTQRIEQEIRLTGRNSFASEATVTFFDQGGAIIGSACAKAVGDRMQ